MEGPTPKIPECQKVGRILRTGSPRLVILRLPEDVDAHILATLEEKAKIVKRYRRRGIIRKITISAGGTLIGWTSAAVGYGVDTWQFWCIAAPLAVFWGIIVEAARKAA